MINGDANGIEFSDPVEMMLFVDDSILEGRVHLHPWQIGFHKEFAEPSTDLSPYQSVLRTCNGAGKDSMIIAPAATWLGARYPYSTSVITSASGTQLDRQTNASIKRICEGTNVKFGQEIWKINYRHYENLVTRSTIELFVTDESGRAEGWHPAIPGAHLGIFTSEAKSIPEDIFHAFARCTGFTKRLDCSTPGLPLGHFFNRCTAGGWKKYHITAYDCPHISKEYIENCKIDYGGEGSVLFKSMVLAEFGTTDEMVVIPYHHVWNAINNQTKVPHFHEQFNIAGLDLAAGGDETVLAIRNGNKVIAIYGFRYEDTTKTVDHLEKLFKENDLQNTSSYIFGDAGGLGKPILDELKYRRGWNNIRYVVNQSTPINTRSYANRGAENWFNFGALIQQGEVLLPSDERMKRQLSARYYKQTEGNKIQLESKLQARAKGHPSPDRADAVVLAFSNYKSRLLDGVVYEEGKPPVAAPPLPETRFDQFELKAHAKRMAAPDFWEQYYGGVGERRKNIDELKYLVEEHNRNKKQLQKV